MELNKIYSDLSVQSKSIQNKLTKRISLKIENVVAKRDVEGVVIN